MSPFSYNHTGMPAYPRLHDGGMQTSLLPLLAQASPISNALPAEFGGSSEQFSTIAGAPGEIKGCTIAAPSPFTTISGGEDSAPHDDHTVIKTGAVG